MIFVRGHQRANRQAKTSGLRLIRSCLTLVSMAASASQAVSRGPHGRVSSPMPRSAALGSASGSSAQAQAQTRAQAMAVYGLMK